MIRSNYTAGPAKVPSSRKNYVPGSFIVASHSNAAPPHLTTMAAAEKASKIREVKKLNDDRKVLTQNLETTRTRSNDLEAELRMARDDLSKTSRALEVTRRMFGALAEEKNVEQQKALALASRVSKLESKLGLSISQTGLAKKNAALR